MRPATRRFNLIHHHSFLSNKIKKILLKKEKNITMAESIQDGPIGMALSILCRAQSTSRYVKRTILSIKQGVDLL